MVNKYVVKVGGKLYIATNMYNLIQSTTTDISKAYMFNTEEAAQKAAAKALNAEVVEIIIATKEEYDEELDDIDEGWRNELQVREAAARHYKEDYERVAKELAELKEGK